MYQWPCMGRRVNRAKFWPNKRTCLLKIGARSTAGCAEMQWSDRYLALPWWQWRLAACKRKRRPPRQHQRRRRPSLFKSCMAWHISTIYGSITSTIRPLSSAPRSLRRALRRSCKIASQVPTTRIPNMRQRDAATLLEHSDVNDQIKKQVSDLDHTRSARTASMIASREYATRWVRGH